jgi:hypothetical protein
MDRTPKQVQAQLTWTLVCERLSFVMDPPAGAKPEGALADLAAAIAQVRHALKELEAAFAPGKKG